MTTDALCTQFSVQTGGKIHPCYCWCNDVTSNCMNSNDEQKSKGEGIKEKFCKISPSFNLHLWWHHVVENIKSVQLVSSFYSAAAALNNEPPHPLIILGGGVWDWQHALHHHPLVSVCLIWSIWGQCLITSQQFHQQAFCSCRPLANSTVICCSTVRSWEPNAYTHTHTTHVHYPRG